jgi:hypothetical protein
MTTPATAPGPGRPPLTPARRWVLAIGVVLSLVLIAWGALMLVNLLGRTTEERSATLPATGGRLVVSSSGGAVRVVSADVDDIRVVSRLRYGLSAPRLRQDSGPDGVHLAASCPWYSSYCSVDYEVTVPTGMAVRADSSGGSITVRGISGAVETASSGGSITVADSTGGVRARSSGGSVTVSAATGSVDLESSGGSILGDRLRAGEVHAESSGGGVRLIFAVPPDLVEASSSGGGVEVLLPRVAGGYRVDASSSGGDRVVEVPTDPASAREVSARSSGGDVRVLSADDG